MAVRIKRVYEVSAPADGTRVLVDRLWPRGVSKADAALDLWLKDVAPSTQLRSSWHADQHGHDPDHFSVFAKAYRAELAELPASEALERLIELAGEHDELTLLYGARDTKINHAVVLQSVLLDRLQG